MKQKNIIKKVKQQRLTSTEMVLNKKWSDPIPSTTDSHIQSHLYQLSQKCDSDFTIEDLRFVILQEIGLDRYIPMAISKLSVNIFAEGDFYPGDLLSATLQVPQEYWENHKEENNMLANILNDMNSSQIEFLDAECPHQLRRLVDSFLRNIQ